MLITVLIATILLACIMHYFLHRLLRHCLEERTLHAIPSPPVGSTILGHTQLAFHPGNQHLQLRTWSDHVRSGIYRLRFGWKKVLMGDVGRLLGEQHSSLLTGHHPQRPHARSKAVRPGKDTDQGPGLPPFDQCMYRDDG